MSSFPRFTLKQLRYFATVAETRNLTEASRRLSVTQSAISVAISALEAQINVQLFIRTPAKGVELTIAGETFLLRARELVGHALELNEFGKELGESLTGELNIGCFSFVAPFFLPALLAMFRERHPLIKITLVENNLYDVQQSLLSGQCDLAFLYDLSLSQRLFKQGLADYSPYILLSGDHPLSRKQFVSLKELADEPLILIDLPHSRDYAASLARKCGINFNVSFKTTSFEMVRSLVAHGHGYSILNQRAALNPTFDGKRVCEVELTDNLPALHLVLAHVSGARQSKRSLAFAETCNRFFHENRAGLRV